MRLKRLYSTKSQRAIHSRKNVARLRNARNLIINYVYYSLWIGMKLKILISEGEDGWFVVECPSIPGCISQGKTVEEALANIKEAIEGCMEVMGEQVLAGNGSLGDGSSCLTHFLGRVDR